jgi:signal transduction histidine kinase
LKASIQADEEYDRLNEIIFRNDRSLAMMSLKEKYSFTEKETELKRLALEKQVIESKNKLLDAENRSAALRNIALENQATQSKAKLLKTQMEVIKKESAIQRAEAQTRLLLGGLIMTLLLIGVVLLFSIRLRQTNKKLIELQAARDKFYTIIAHDLRTPLNSLHNLGLLIRNLLQQDRKEDIETIVKHIEQMDQHSHLIINNLLEWGKVQSFNKEATDTQQKVDVPLLLQEVSQSYLPIAEAKGISLSVKTLPSFVLNTNAKGFTIALRNLLDNAIKHTPKGGEIMVSSEIDELNQIGGMVISIQDTGEGILPEKLSHLRQVFAGKIKAEVGIGGLGLGMVLIEDFVRKNKAHLTINSVVGKGTAIEIRMW